jgi:hypothetical protein
MAHHHAHPPARPHHPPSAWSLFRMSVGARLGLAACVSALLWVAIGWALA